MKKMAIGAAVLIVVFLLGYIPSYLSARQAQEQKARLEYKLKLTELLGQLGMLNYEAHRNNYANAAKFASEFFNGVGKLAEATDDPPRKQKLQAVVNRRDEITAHLAQPDPAVKEKTAQMYADFFQIADIPQGP